MKPLSKISDQNGTDISYQNIWERQVFPSWSRINIGAKERGIPLVLDLCRTMKGPFSILYVLTVSRLGNETARYQSSETISYDNLELFLYTFQEFFEQDGRHHIWVSSQAGEGQFIIDNHNTIYAYGDLDSFEVSLRSSGFTEGEIELPYPHQHHYHPEFDSSEDDVLNYWAWIKSSLQPEDNPR